MLRVAARAVSPAARCPDQATARSTGGEIGDGGIPPGVGTVGGGYHLPEPPGGRGYHQVSQHLEPEHVCVQRLGVGLVPVQPELVVEGARSSSWSR